MFESNQSWPTMSITSAFNWIDWGKSRNILVKTSVLWAREMNLVNYQVGRKWEGLSDCKFRCVLFHSERLVIFPTRTVHCSSSTHQSTPPSQLLFWTVLCQLWPFILGCCEIHEEILLYITFLISDTGLEVSDLHGKPSFDMKGQNSLQQKDPLPFIVAFRKTAKSHY